MEIRRKCDDAFQNHLYPQLDGCYQNDIIPMSISVYKLIDQCFNISITKYMKSKAHSNNIEKMVQEWRMSVYVKGPWCGYLMGMHWKKKGLIDRMSDDLMYYLETKEIPFLTMQQCCITPEQIRGLKSVVIKKTCDSKENVGAVLFGALRESEDIYHNLNETNENWVLHSPLGIIDRATYEYLVNMKDKPFCFTVDYPDLKQYLLHLIYIDEEINNRATDTIYENAINCNPVLRQ